MSMSPRLLRPRGTAFSPRFIPGLALWLDAADASTIDTVSGAVSEWRDKSTNGRHFTQSTANNRPSYATTVNGRNAITFDGDNDVLFRSGALSPTLLSSTDGATALYVFRPNSDTTFAVVNVCTAGVGHIDRFSDGNTYHGNLRVARFEGVANGLITSTGTQLITSRVEGASNTHALRRNKTQIHSGTSNLSAFRSGSSVNLAAGAGVATGTPTFGSYFNGEICEIILVAGTMTDASFRSCENYLSAKWGVS
jgi:hypothetical protein